MNNFIVYPFYTTFGFPIKELFSSVNLMMLMISEVFHLLNIILHFFKAYKLNNGNEKFVTKFDKVWRNYFFNQFLIDFIVFLPLGMLGNIRPELSALRLLWFIKLQRIHSFLEIIDEKFYNPILR